MSVTFPDKPITPDEIRIRIRRERIAACKVCQGAGEVDCPACDGHGRDHIDCDFCGHLCDECLGDGTVPCEECSA